MKKPLKSAALFAFSGPAALGVLAVLGGACRVQPKPPAMQTVRLQDTSLFEAELKRGLSDLARGCNYDLDCYLSGGLNYIEFKACRKEALAPAGFDSEEECREAGIKLLDSLAKRLEKKIKLSNPRR